MLIPSIVDIIQYDGTVLSYCMVGMTKMWAWSTKINQAKIIFANPSRPLDSIGQV